MKPRFPVPGSHDYPLTEPPRARTRRLRQAPRYASLASLNQIGWFES